jgi:hypothetical protein
MQKQEMYWIAERQVRSSPLVVNMSYDRVTSFDQANTQSYKPKRSHTAALITVRHRGWNTPFISSFNYVNINGRNCGGDLRSPLGTASLNLSVTGVLSRIEC